MQGLLRSAVYDGRVTDGLREYGRADDDKDLWIDDGGMELGLRGHGVHRSGGRSFQLSHLAYVFILDEVDCACIGAQFGLSVKVLARDI